MEINYAQDGLSNTFPRRVFSYITLQYTKAEDASKEVPVKHFTATDMDGNILFTYNHVDRITAVPGKKDIFISELSEMTGRILFLE
jgi:hypothetical protein